jgi:hypothetical protein
VEDGDALPTSSCTIVEKLVEQAEASYDSKCAGIVHYYNLVPFINSTVPARSTTSL